MSVSQLQNEISQLQLQKARAQQAYYSGSLPLGSYDNRDAAYAAFNSRQDQIIAQKTAQLRALQSQSPSSTPVTSSKSVSSPMPAEHGSSGYVVQQSSSGQTLIQKGFVVTDKQETPKGTLITVESQAAVNARAAEAKSAREIKPSVFSGENIVFAGQQPVVKSNADRLTAIGAITAVVATPVMGVSVAAKGAVTGVGVAQGIKTGEAALFGGDVSKSLLTPREAVEAASGGVLFSGVGGAANQALGITGKGLTKAVSRVATSGGIGAGASAGIEVVKTGKVTAENVLVGTAFGVGFGAVGEAAGPIAGKAGQLLNKTSMGKSAIKTFGKVKEDIIGTKFTEITGAKEVIAQTPVGKQSIITRVTQPETKTITLRGKEAEFYKKNNLESMKNPVIELEGTQTIKVIQKDAGGALEEITTYPKTQQKPVGEKAKFDLVGDVNKEFGGVIESVKSKGGETPLRDSTVVTSTRSAKPLLKALAGETVSFEKITPISETKITTTKGRVNSGKPLLALGSDKPVTVLEKTSIIKEGQFLPASKSAVRQYSAVKVYDKPVNASNVLGKATGKPQIKGGLETPELFEKVTGKIAEAPAKPTDTPPLINQEQIKILGEQGKTQGIFDKAIVDKVAFNKRELGDLSGPMKAGSNDFFRAGVKEPSAKMSGVKTETVQTTKAVKEKLLPKRAIVGEVKADVSVKGSAWSSGGNAVNIWSKQQQSQETVDIDVISYPKNSPLSSPKIITGQNREVSKASMSGVASISSVGLTAKQQARFLPNQTSKGQTGVSHIPIMDVTPIVSPTTTPVQTPKLIPDVVPKTTVGQINLVSSSARTKLGPGFFDLPRGGGSGGGGSKHIRGVWGRRTHAIPLPKQLKKQMLGGKSALKVRSLVSTSNALTKSKKRRKRKR